jgi:thiol-disulfide isomerase/thioredoxin
MNRAELKQKMNMEKLIILRITATWCGPCKKLAPYLNEELAKLDERVLILEIDYDKGANICSYLKIKSVPTLMNVINGEIQDICTSSLHEEVAKFMKKTMNRLKGVK